MIVLSLFLLPLVFLSLSESPPFIVLSHAQYPSYSPLSCPLLSLLQFVQSSICWKGSFSLLESVGPWLLIACWQWPLYPAIKQEKKPIGETRKLWKVILVKELETIIVSVKCREIQPVSKHKSLNMSHVLTSMALSKVWTCPPLVSCFFFFLPRLTRYIQEP